MKAKKLTIDEFALFISSPPCWLHGYGGINGMVISHHRDPKNPCILGGWMEKAIAEALHDAFDPKVSDTENAKAILIELTRCAHHVDQAMLVMRTLTEKSTEWDQIRKELAEKKKEEKKHGRVG